MSNLTSPETATFLADLRFTDQSGTYQLRTFQRDNGVRYFVLVGPRGAEYNIQPTLYRGAYSFFNIHNDRVLMVDGAKVGVFINNDRVVAFPTIELAEAYAQTVNAR